MSNDYDEPVQVENYPAPPPPAPQTLNYAASALAGCYPGELPLEEKLRYQAQQWLMILRQAHAIRQDPDAMAAVRHLIRRERDELAAVLDDA